MQLRDLMASMQIRSAGYPTKEEILDAEPKHKVAVIAYIKEWKMTAWKEVKRSDSQPLKFQALSGLIKNLASEFYDKPVDVEYNPHISSCCYQPQLKKITINESLSIISSLHELAHHLFGRSEKKACIWSVHLFRKTFPTAYKRLEWNGHMMVKSKENTCSQ